MHIKNQIIVFSALAFLIVLPESSYAIPAFARKYDSSCATCHTGFPKLNPFGEAFRMNGMQWPDMGEDDHIEEEPVNLGSEGYKRVWPKAVWPNAIPGTAPVSFRVRQGFNIISTTETSYSEFTLPALQIMTGGTMGEDISFYAGAHLFEHGEAGSIDRMYLKLNNMFSQLLPYNALHLRMGQFVPEIVPFITNHRGLTLTSYAFNTYAPSTGHSFVAGHVHGAPAFGLESFQVGVEASGIIKQRLRFVLGMVNGTGVEEENNAAKDFYYRLAYKLGGIAYDGTFEGDVFGQGGNNWAEKSLAIGTFGYFGTNYDGTNDVGITRFGVDYNLSYRDINLYGGLITGMDEMFESDALTDESYTLIFTEANYMVYPWLIGVLRYEQADLEDGDSIKRLVPSITALYTVNIKFIIEAPMDLDNTDDRNIQIGLDFAF
jgi:hypothetical protein